MKKLTFISVALFSFDNILTALPKLMNWQGTSALPVLGLAGFALVFIPCYAKYKYDQLHQILVIK